MAEPKRDVTKDIPDVIVNPSKGKRYLKGKFLGKGGFARCYELTELDSNNKTIYAGKIVSKTLLQKKHQKDKMSQEIAIHRALNHRHVVEFHDFFEDEFNVYITLELCRRRSLMELHKRRRAITEPEARYFVYQIVDACQYLHREGVIHRDLKLGNLFLNEEMEVKIGDFGLATRVSNADERKKTLCGTPNYIAPEMLSKKGHSFEVDMWAIGCILYTLLVGKPPFETQSLKETYLKIKKNDYHIPSRVGPQARQLISRLLAPDPTQRPNIFEMNSFDFFTYGYMPARLPTSCLTMAPKFPSVTSLSLGTGRKALLDNNNAPFAPEMALSPKEQVRKDMMTAPLRTLNAVPENQILVANGAVQQFPTDPSRGVKVDTEIPSDYYLQDLYGQLTKVVHSRPNERNTIQEDESEDPAATPVFWIGKWVDYSDKYGLGYQLCDNSVGVLFNDSSKLVLDGAGEQIQYIERDNRESYYTINQYPESLGKKITLLKYFRNYMNDHLLKAGAHMAPKDGDELARLPCLRTWFRTRSAIVLHLTNGTLQVNFFEDHTKVILCPLMGAVTYIDSSRQFKTFRMSLVEQYGCTKELASRLRYARTMVERLLTSSSSCRPGALSTASKPQSTSSNANIPSIATNMEWSSVVNSKVPAK